LSAKIYLAKLYLKNFFITLLGLELFFLLIDYLQNQKNIPDSANLLVLYFYYQSFAALKIT
jgi:lipopolysaccharide export system permease protein